MKKRIIVEVNRFGGAEFDGVHVCSSDLEKTIKELYLGQDFTFMVKSACWLVTDSQVAKVKKLLGV